MFHNPQINIYSDDVGRGVRFYEDIGFTESFRTPQQGDLIHVEMTLDGFTLGIASGSLGRSRPRA